MQITRRIPEIAKARTGDFDPRVLASLLQKAVCGTGNEKA